MHYSPLAKVRTSGPTWPESVQLAVTRFPVGSTVGGLVNRGSGKYRFCLFLGRIGLASLPCLVEWCYDKGLPKGPQLGPKSVAC